MSYQKILDAIPKAEILKYLKKNTSLNTGGREVGASTASRKAMIRKMHEIPVKNSKNEKSI
ncbi:hypothetical protein H0S70_06960 [Chryseobacterium manosquense]|uniref:Uncharacterized protein n=1 Tax=Chryseobacterium manosquense TaxID=2754694 RepID=A0A7H1DT39_9FLAO|nr:hypothetical protein [Chryseobacterium manosquense]QNS40147.1 hypothetical protein H0S70_06960 [Chryseobacterium manosquense]